MDQEFAVRTKYDLVVAQEQDGRLLDTKEVGDAFNYEGTNYFILNFWSLEKPFFLVPNRGQETRYTIFRKKIDDDNGPFFQKPVGRAWVPLSLKTHLHMVFNFPREHAFMCLFPQTV